MFRRLFSTEPDTAFTAAILDYIEGTAEFSDEMMMLHDHKTDAERREEDIDLVNVWRGIDRSDDPICTGRNGVVKLARRLLSVIANSAACERIFSEFGITHTRLCNRLAPETVHKTSVVKMDIRRKHAEACITSRRLKRKFGHGEPQESPDSNSLENSLTGSEMDDIVPDPEAINAQLIADATDAAIDPSEDHETPPAASTSTAPQRAPRAKTKIPLAKLFKFPVVAEDGGILEFYWKGGVKNLDQELEYYDLATSSGTPS